MQQPELVQGQRSALEELGDRRVGAEGGEVARWSEVRVESVNKLQRGTVSYLCRRELSYQENKLGSMFPLVMCLEITDHALLRCTLDLSKYEM